MWGKKEKKGKKGVEIKRSVLMKEERSKEGREKEMKNGGGGGKGGNGGKASVQLGFDSGSSVCGPD